MAIKKVKIRIQSLEESFKEAKKVARELDKGIFKKRTPVFGFETIEVYRKTLTPKRLEILEVTKTKKPKTISELAKLTKRDFKNVYTDVKFLEGYDLIKLKKTNLGLMPNVIYDEIDIKIPLTISK